MEDSYVALAKESLETYIKTGHKMQKPDGLPQEMLDRQAGVFVSLKKHGDLRGCIGTIQAVTPSIADEIIQYAIVAGTEDPRFPPVKENELADLTYSVDVLDEPEPVTAPNQLDAKEYGVIVALGWKRGLLLPNLDGVDTPVEQIQIALQKADIRQNEPYELFRFRVVRHQ